MPDSGKDLTQRPSPLEEQEDKDDGEMDTSAYAMAIALGLPFGAVIGLIFFDNLAMGAAFGLVFAPVIAMMMSKAKS